MIPRAMIILLGVAFCLPFLAEAQEQNVAAILTLERKRDVSIADFEAALKKHLDFRLAEGEGRNHHVYTPLRLTTTSNTTSATVVSRLQSKTPLTNISIAARS